VEGNRNFTLKLPEPLLHKLRVYAARRNQTMTDVINEAIRKTVEDDNEYEQAKQRLLTHLKNPPNLGTHGRITWTRDEIHDRRLR
jgi:hypothetical protein